MLCKWNWIELKVSQQTDWIDYQKQCHVAFKNYKQCDETVYLYVFQWNLRSSCREGWISADVHPCCVSPECSSIRLESRSNLILFILSCLSCVTWEKLFHRVPTLQNFLFPPPSCNVSKILPLAKMHQQASEEINLHKQHFSAESQWIRKVWNPGQVLQTCPCTHNEQLAIPFGVICWWPYPTFSNQPQCPTFSPFDMFIIDMWFICWKTVVCGDVVFQIMSWWCHVKPAQSA